MTAKQQSIYISVCRRECLELNENPIVRVQIFKDNSIVARICYNMTKQMSKYPLFHRLYSSDELQETLAKEKAQSFSAIYVCDRGIGVWEFSQQHLKSQYKTSNVICPQVRHVSDIRSCPPIGGL
ncbi:hypothetical protein X798_05817 [Onchocerca flexuosa]|uniref:Uncharacterized protein n=1 Tax=Onchocerca flexuosa TaxID=387005 RepID=A0A238BP71_9BILA|nr:hypothetical protein X798_05817 [Onchocerca flexuosa]